MNIKQKNNGTYNIDNLPLYISLWYFEDGKYKYAHIKTKDFKGVQDAQIGDFYENWFCRPKKAVQSKPYKTLKAYKIACLLSFKRIKPNAIFDCFSVDSEDSGPDTIQTVI